MARRHGVMVSTLAQIPTLPKDLISAVGGPIFAYLAVYARLHLEILARVNSTWVYVPTLHTKPASAGRTAVSKPFSVTTQKFQQLLS
jgi:hypothetical protein